MVSTYKEVRDANSLIVAMDAWILFVASIGVL